MQLMARICSTVLLIALSVLNCSAKVVEYTFTVEDWVVDFKRPTLDGPRKDQQRKSPFDIKEENRKAAILVNGQYPGPTVEAFENDTVVIKVVNKMLSEATTIHWHGIHPVDTPWTDGTYGVSQAAIGPGGNFTYKFRAWPSGTHYWHSHMDGMQSAKGMRGAFIVHKPKEGPQMPHYDEEKVISLADEWRDPAVCLKLEGAMAGNDVCSDVDYASVNGEVATGDLQKYDKEYPYPLIDVEEGKCYRLRFIMMASNAENYIVQLAGHNMTLVALDGVDVDPIQINSFNIRIGERVDVVMCANQKAGYYPIAMQYDYACTLTPGNFIPPGFHSVSSCNFYAFLHYQHQKEGIFTYEAPVSPKGTGGGAHPAQVTGTRFDLTNFAEDWRKTKPVEVRPEPEEPDVRFHITLGLTGPIYSKPTDEPLQRGKWYMDVDKRRESWSKPTTPLLHTKNRGCNANVPAIDIPEGARTVEVVINNLGPAAHNLHLHGMLFQVINVANFSWCTVNKTACFLMPKQVNPCPRENRVAADENDEKGIMDLYWGCKYNNETDKATQNLEAPLRKDSFQVWQRSWAVIRFVADAPGIWQFHCHMEQHIPLGMVMALNVLPSQQKPIPEDVPTEGPCPVWSTPSKAGKLEAENAELRKQVAELQLAAKRLPGIVV